MDCARRSTRIARLVSTTGPDGADESKNNNTSASGNAFQNLNDPAVPSQDGTCHFMRLPPELRLTIAEHLFDDFFTSLTRGLYPPFFKKGESVLPLTQDLIAVLHVNQAIRAETVGLCTRLANESFEVVNGHIPATWRDPWDLQETRMRLGPHEQLKSRHKKILKVLGHAKRSIGDDEPDGSLHDDSRNTREKNQSSSKTKHDPDIGKARVRGQRYGRVKHGLLRRWL